MFKGIEPVIAIVLLVSIVVGITSTTYYYFWKVNQKIEIKTEDLLKKIDISKVELKLDTAGDCKVYLMNSSTEEVPLQVITFYIAELNSNNFREVDYSSSLDILKQYDNAEVNFSGLDPNIYKLIVKIGDNSMDFGLLNCKDYLPTNLCTIRTNCEFNETEIIAFSDLTNAYVELPSEGNYPYKLCCRNILDIRYRNGIDCDSLYTGLFALSTNSSFTQNTNCLVEKYDLSGNYTFDYKKNVCVALVSGVLNCTYDVITNCNLQNYNNYLISFSGETNARVGNETSYPLVLCCK
jgi:hypothetical protein